MFSKLNKSYILMIIGVKDMKKKEEILEISDKKITSKDVINLIGHLVGVFIFAKKVYDYYKK